MPGIFDSGWAKRIIDFLRTKHEVLPTTYGTMGRTALFDSGLEREIQFVKGEPSEILTKISKTVDAFVLPMYATSPLKSHAHCWHLLKSSGITKPLVEIEAKSRCVIPWNKEARELSSWIASGLRLELKEAPAFGETFWVSGGKKYRRILGVEVGDYVMVNRVVIGRANSENVILVEENGVLTEFVGVDLKLGGLRKLQKLEKIDLKKIRVETTSSLRFTTKKPRMIEIPKRSGVVFIDHAGYDVYDLAWGVEGVVVVGDDTSSIVGDILFRLQVPILGIVDGDEDKLLKGSQLSEGSVILTVENDDSVGEEVFRKVFKRKARLGRKFSEVKREIIFLLRDKIKRILEV